MSELTPMQRPALGPDRRGLPSTPPAAENEQFQEGARPLPPRGWAPWTAPVALVAGLILAAIGALVIDIPAYALGAEISSSHTPPGLAIANTFVQDVAFVLAAAYFAHLGGRAVRASHFGLRPPTAGWRSAAKMILLLLVAFVVLSAAWTAIFHPSEEKLLEKLGSDESTLLLVLSAGLTCVVAPICEEVLFRGFIFVALRNWRGVLPAALITGLLFGGVHAGSAPALDLVPLGVLGFALCLLYQRTGSLYPCIVAHSLNNSIAFASLESWNWWQAPLLVAGALAGIGALVRAAKRLGVITRETSVVGPAT